jgi:hypothetical protein
MAGSDWDRENPYASPKGMGEGLAHEDPEEDPDEFVIEPSLRPRDLTDVLCSLLVFFEATVLLGLVAAATGTVAYWLPGDWGGILALAIVGILLLAGAIYEMLCQLRRLRIDAAGIAFKRGLGKPKFLTWHEIRGIRPATRWEVLIYAWLWLWLEPTKSESTAGHYRIEWTAGYVYFPPKDRLLFERAIRKFCPRLLGDE